MATFTAYKRNLDKLQPIAIASFSYGIVLLIAITLSLPDQNPIYLEKEHLPKLNALLDKINRGFNVSELDEGWSYQINPGELDLRCPLEEIINSIQSSDSPLMVLED